MTNDELYTTITVEDLSCMTACSFCGGAKLGVDLCQCQTCHGTGVVFRDDEVGRERIAEATGDWFVRYSIQYPCRNKWIVDCARPQKATEWVWDNRIVQPWQKSIEDHVRNYRVSAPDLKADDGKELKKILRKNGYGYMIVCGRNDTEIEASVWGEDDCGDNSYTDNEADALFDAACAAVLFNGVES